MSTQHPSPVAGAAATSSATAIATPERSAQLCTAPRLCLTVGEAIDAYMQNYSGRDPARLYRLESWKRRVGDRLLAEFSDDDVFHELEAVAAEPARVFMGLDADGARIYRAKKTAKAPATINAYANSLAAVFTWCIKKRRVPKSFENLCRKVERLPSRPGVVRFLSDDERTRLLAACKASCWPKLYALVLMALTTGARRSELLGLR